MATGEYPLTKNLVPVDRRAKDPARSPEVPPAPEVPVLRVVVDRDSSEFTTLSREKVLRERLGPGPVPPEYVLSEYRTPSYEDLVESGYAVYAQLETGRAYRTPDNMVGLYIDQVVDNPEGGTARTTAYRRFTTGEQEMIRTAPQFGPVHIGREDPQNAYKRRIEIRDADVSEGILDTVSRTHVECGTGHFLRDVSTYGGTHMVCETPDVALRSPILRERTRNREIYPATAVPNAEFARVDIRHPEQLQRLAGALLNGNLSNDPAQFVSQAQAAPVLEGMTREQLRQAVDRLRWHVFQAPTELPPSHSVTVLETYNAMKGKYAQDMQLYDRVQIYRQNMVRALEQVLNPLIASSTISKERTQVWKERIAERPGYDEESMHTYMDALQFFDHQRDWSQTFPDMNRVTTDQGFKDKYTAWQTEWGTKTLTSEARQQLVQLNHAYHRWLENAVAFFQKQKSK